jgi:hypothetical protein
MTKVQADRAVALENGSISGRRRRTWLPMVSLEPPEKDASLNTPYILNKGPEATKQLLTKSAITPTAEFGHSRGWSHTLIRGP